MACRQTSLSFGCKLYRNVLVMVAYHRSYHLPFSTVWSSSSRSLSLSLSVFLLGAWGWEKLLYQNVFWGVFGDFYFYFIGWSCLDCLLSGWSLVEEVFHRLFFYSGILLHGSSRSASSLTQKSVNRNEETVAFYSDDISTESTRVCCATTMFSPG